MTGCVFVIKNELLLCMNEMLLFYRAVEYILDIFATTLQNLQFFFWCILKSEALPGQIAGIAECFSRKLAHRSARLHAAFSTVRDVISLLDNFSEIVLQLIV